MILNVKDYPNVKKLLRARGYRKHKFIINVETVLAPHSTYWDGGSRNTYVVVNIDGETHEYIPQYGPFELDKIPLWNIMPGYPILEDGVYLGKDKTVTLWINPNDIDYFQIG